ncbi:MAG: hypothetical protein Q9218_006024 [Villophora microphyllina]
MPSMPVPSSNVQLTAQMSGTDGFLVTRSGHRLPRTPFIKSDPFPFLKLPSEIRNMIYRFTLAQGAAVGSCGHSAGLVSITNMDPSRYKKEKKRKRIRARTSYKAMLDVHCCCACPGHWNTETTTYRLASCQKLPASGLLMVNKQITAEAVPIFYGENHFVFNDMTAVVPFLRDRSVIARQHIRDVHLSFDLYYHDGHHSDRQAVWIRAFRYITWHLNLTVLSVEVIDLTFRWWAPLKLVGRKKKWLRVLTGITNLKRLGLSIIHEGEEHYLDTLGDDVADDEEYEAEIGRFYDWLADNRNGYEQYLKTRMLKKKQGLLDDWLSKHVCSAECKKIRKGRRAQKSGLLKSDTQGCWTLPEVDLDALYYLDFPDELDDDDYSDYNEENGYSNHYDVDDSSSTTST